MRIIHDAIARRIERIETTDQRQTAAPGVALSRAQIRGRASRLVPGQRPSTLHALIDGATRGMGYFVCGIAGVPGGCSLSSTPPRPSVFGSPGTAGAPSLGAGAVVDAAPGRSDTDDGARACWAGQQVGRAAPDQKAAATAAAHPEAAALRTLQEHHGDERRRDHEVHNKQNGRPHWRSLSFLLRRRGARTRRH